MVVCVCVLVGGHSLQMTNLPAHQHAGASETMLIFLIQHACNLPVRLDTGIDYIRIFLLCGDYDPLLKRSAMPQEDEKPEVLSLCHWDHQFGFCRMSEAL